ncbi:hypothetical protein PAXRUDRAFT_825966 [Paxillus rubicundulus Ve08.2h10]|uniref:Cytochrome c oxidase assembly factor 3 n=1 Tax=Paxillus rubicundulus Ve08.2h10 TaxID=930991 RepID=A0A0D0DFE7_9AGAM|nr:hypothetical protein PAXRUDRAFT_825966 [Paxillus rubicundulus Ve08.2h10]
MPESYVSSRVVNKSYRPRSSMMSPGLLRARAPFRLRNALTGLVLAAFGVGIWAYSISAVKQDDFSDVDEEAREMIKGRVATAGGMSAGEREDVGADVDGRGVRGEVSTPREDVTSPGPLGPSSSSYPPPIPPRGVLVPILDRTFPRLLDPTRKTLVWGAPPLDNPGRMSLKSSNQEQR